jgi:hypothetical protein
LAVSQKTVRGRSVLIVCCLLLFAVLFRPAAAQDSLFYIFSRSTPPSTISRSLAGAGTALPFGGFQGIVNPALTTAAGAAARGVLSAGYGRDPAFDRLALPFGAVFAENQGALGAFYRCLNGSQGTVHDGVLNLAGRMFEQVDKQGPVEFGLNIRYEQSKWRHRFPVPDGGGEETAEVTAYAKNILFDIGFYQPYVLPGLDFSLVATNLNGYRWLESGVTEKQRGWMGLKYCSVIVGAAYSLPLMNGNLLFQLPLDMEFANLFNKSVKNNTAIRTGLDTRIMQMFNARFGYAHAPEDPLGLITDFDYKNLFFGGIGVFVKPVQLDFFAGKDEFGVTASYWY